MIWTPFGTISEGSLADEMKLIDIVPWWNHEKIERAGIVSPRWAGIFEEWVTVQDLIDLLAIQ